MPTTRHFGYQRPELHIYSHLARPGALLATSSSSPRQSRDFEIVQAGYERAPYFPTCMTEPDDSNLPLAPSEAPSAALDANARQASACSDL